MQSSKIFPNKRDIFYVQSADLNLLMTELGNRPACQHEMTEEVRGVRVHRGGSNACSNDRQGEKMKTT